MKRFFLVISMCVWFVGCAQVYGFLEDRVYCQIVDGSLRVSLDEGELLCQEYRSRIYTAHQVAIDAAEQAGGYASAALLEEDRDYRLAVRSTYDTQAQQLLKFYDHVANAVSSYEKVVLLRVQGFLSHTLNLTKLRCQNTWKILNSDHLSSRRPLCRLGQEKQIQTMQTTDDLDEFARVLQAYITKRKTIAQLGK